MPTSASASTPMSTNEVRYQGDHVYLIVNLYRPGAATLITRLEYENYSPDDPAQNDLFSLYLNQVLGQPHAVIGFPAVDLDTVVRPLVAELKLRLVRGVPSQVVSPTEIRPLIKIDHSPDMVYTVERECGNQGGGGTPGTQPTRAGLADPEEHKRLIREEQISLKAYLRAHTEG